MAAASFLATAARMCRMNSSAAGRSTAWKRTRLSVKEARKAILLASRSSLATSSTASSRRAKAMAASGWGRALLRPLSTSIQSASARHRPAALHGDLPGFEI